MPFSLNELVRPNILKLLPYRCARDDYNGPGYIFLDANENAYGPSLGSDYLDTQALNRYPDPNQAEVKQLLCELRGGDLTPDNLFIGVGSDEAIDCVLRVFCSPAQDKILITPPTYGMYSVSATINDVGVLKIPLDESMEFQPRVPEILKALEADRTVKVLFFCSPGNPSSKLVDQKHIKAVLESGWNGIVVVDEAYIDFSLEGSSVCTWVNSFPNLIVLQTLSKAFGLAAIRLGAAFTSPTIAKIMNSLKAPYNISSPTSALAIRALEKGGLATMRTHVARLNAAREELAKSLLSFEHVKTIIGGTEANFIMAQIQTAEGKISNELAYKIYEDMAEKRGVVIRFRGHEHGCEGCLRVTVGTEEENEILLQMLQKSFNEHSC
ncbi:Histidinol-phosphate aminotransferase [Taphrina deformans PYCC 5710]|uniref:histidinol-phosphate transaminase n=1 Tax=Taphrina deformans (strain PYCC 5710 / ATCC 11124 / CBS 356.35 / IMI 108563 / JCM 9778 / NBRC 8474) TaxID=1097556 RepID=R4X954_TAPDE|nr:Histidinol-phosphate aminotransferase [Taphrina deformans PYCC 5710]|eukprot:CCG82236.1 Histidinol-phosphate aminotransferase [Taphrina deformans PYCC 5710]